MDGSAMSITVRWGGLLTDISVEQRDDTFWMRGRPFRSFARIIQYYMSIKEPICTVRSHRLGIIRRRWYNLDWQR